MKLVPLQQHIYFTNALQAAGINSFIHETGAILIRKGPVLYAAGLDADAPLGAVRNTPKTAICVASLDAVNHQFARAAGFRQVMTPATVAELDLTQPMQMHAKWRHAVQKAQDGPLKTLHRSFDMAKDYWLLANDMAQQRAKKFRAMPHAIVQNWSAHETQISVALDRKTPVAAMLFLKHGPTVTYQIGGANEAGRSLCAHHRLLREATAIFTANGHQRLDLGMIDTENAIDLARFKLRSGAAARKLGGTWIAPRRLFGMRRPKVRVMDL